MDLFDSVKAVISTEFEKTWSRKPGKNAVEVLVWLGDKEADLKKELKKYKKNPPHVLKPFQRETEPVSGHGGLFKPSAFGAARDCVGQWVRCQHKAGDSVHIRFLGGAIEHRVGALVGILIASYKYIAIVKGQERKLKFHFSDRERLLENDHVGQAEALAAAVNLSRHLANTPAGNLNPETYADTAKAMFSKSKRVKVKVLEEAELKREKLNLLRAVGQGSVHGARLIHLSYRNGRSASPVAFVGKGITFDSGGLDIKPAAGMRLMKKDMAGSATVLALCYLCDRLGISINADFYLAVAENSVSDRSMRPGDVFETRDGRLVEIDNTDAEGRLALADGITYALAAKTRPETLIDVSTLTGAMRVAVGLDIAGYFSNDDALADEFEAASVGAGDAIWRMPLYRKYASGLKSDFADFKNSADSGFGGAITAALFLEKFVTDVRWGHFDMMAWNPGADSVLGSGANAQTLQALAFFLFKREMDLQGDEE